MRWWARVFLAVLLGLPLSCGASDIPDDRLIGQWEGAAFDGSGEVLRDALAPVLPVPAVPPGRLIERRVVPSDAGPAAAPPVTSHAGTRFTPPLREDSEIEITLPEPASELVLSWNALASGDGSLAFAVQGELSSGKWTRWYKMGSWGRGAGSVGGQNDSVAEVKIDTLVLKNGASARHWRVRVEFSGAAQLDRLELTGRRKDGAPDKGSLVVMPPMEMPRLLSQPDGRTCSPTSALMALAASRDPSLRVGGISPSAFRSSVYDPAAGIYGNWSFNVAAMYKALKTAHPDRDFDVSVRLYSSLDQVLARLQGPRAFPAAVSLSYNRGELSGAVPSSTAGHLVVVRGADERYVYVSNPAERTAGSINTRFDRSQFARAWKGAAYVIEAGP